MRSSTVSFGVVSHALARVFIYGTLLFTSPLQIASGLVAATMAVDLLVHFRATQLLLKQATTS